MQFYSQNGQDAYLYNHGFNFKGGHFIEIGAYDGITNSNSKFFEEELGWDCLLVEANPNIAQKLQTNRPKAKIIKGAATSHGGKENFICASGYCEQLSGIERAYNPAHKGRLISETIAHRELLETVTVDCFMLNQILFQTPANILSIDTEGSEVEIINSLNWGVVGAPQIVMVENPYGERYSNNFYKNYKEEIRIGSDIIFRRSW